MGRLNSADATTDKEEAGDSEGEHYCQLPRGDALLPEDRKEGLEMGRHETR